MGKIINTLLGRLILAAIGIHVVLLPVLFNSLSQVVENSHKAVFIDYVRSYSRFLADTLIQEVDEGHSLAQLLDSSVLSGDVVYAEITDSKTDMHILSSFLTDIHQFSYAEDFAFGEHGDDIYSVSIPIDIPNRDMVLRLGFDEQPTLESIADARQRTVFLLSIYLAMFLGLVVLLSSILTRPLRELAKASRKIAYGRHNKHLEVKSSIPELNDLAKDLEFMRSGLVGTTLRLKKEISDRAAVEESRKKLEAQLLHAQKMETIGTLAGGISHELNNILVPILLYTDLTRDDLPKDSDGYENLTKVMNSTRQAKKLIQQILTFSRSTIDHNLIPVKLQLVIEEVLEMIRVMLPVTIEIEQNVDADCGPVLADPSQLNQVVVNLCNNAFLAMKKSGGILKVGLSRVQNRSSLLERHPLLKGVNYLKLSVSDTGQGMTQQTMNRVFEPFFTTREINEGTGLGLSVVHGIVLDIGGSIDVTSEPGKGSIFCGFLPEISQQELAYYERESTAGLDNE